MIDLNKPDLTNLPIGELVKTTKGFIWEVVGTGLWRDKTTNLTWGPIHKEKLNHHEAVEKYVDKLPTKEDFKAAEKHGIREVMDMNGKWFWSSSVVPNGSDSAYDFSGDNGGIGYGDCSYNYDAAVCVSGR